MKFSLVVINVKKTRGIQCAIYTLLRNVAKDYQWQYMDVPMCTL